MPQVPWCSIRDLFDVRLFVDCTVDVAMRRVARRHMQAWGISADKAEARVELSASTRRESRYF